MARNAERISEIIVELGAEVSDINCQIDEVNEEIRKNAARPPARSEIEAALREKIDLRAARYKESLKFEFRRPFPVTYTSNRLLAGGSPLLNHSGLDILRLQNSEVMIPGLPLPTDFRLLEDAFAWVVKMMGKPAIDDLMASAPTGGIPQTEKEANDVKLRDKKRQLETKLEESYVQLERCGLEPDRRPDLSPEIFLEFDGLGPWNREKLETLRQRQVGIRANRSKLAEKRAELTQESGKLQQLQEGNHRSNRNDDALDRKIAALLEEQKIVEATLSGLGNKFTRGSKFFQRCISFLREHGVDVDHHV